MKNCNHAQFACAAEVQRMSEFPGGPVVATLCSLQVKCRQCGVPFNFTGTPEISEDTKLLTVQISAPFVKRLDS